MPEEQFFNKLGEIPVLNDGWTTAWNCYSKVKDYNSLTKFTLGVAESGVKKAAAISTPVISNYQSQIDSVNNYACRKIDEIENRYPIIRQPSAEVKDACVEYIQPVVGRVKPMVTYVQGVVDSSKKQVVQVKTFSTNLVVGARDLGMNSVNHAVTATLSTGPGRFVTRTVDGVLTHTENLVDKYIPEETQKDIDAGNDEGNSGSPAAAEEMEVMEPSPERVVIHFKSVTGKVRRHLFQRAMKDFQGAKIRTLDAVEKLQHTVDLIDYARKNIGAAREKVENLWTQIIDTDENSNSGSVQAQTLENRIVSLGRILARQVKSGISTLEKASTETGLFVRHPITKSKEYKDFVYHFSSDLMTLSVDKARATLTHIQKRLLLMIDNVESPEWLAMNIEVEDMDLEEEDNASNNQISDEEAEAPRPENHTE